mgnify:CR=1 FL=1
MKYFDMKLGYVLSHVSHFLGGSPSRDLIADMVMHEVYDLHMSNIAAMLISVEESSFNLYTKLLAGGKIEKADLERRADILAMGVFIYKEICYMIKYLSNDASISMLRKKDMEALNEVIPPLENLIQACIKSSNDELPIFMIFSDTILDTSEFKWDDVKIDENDTDFPIDPQKYLDVSDEFLEYYDNQISKQYKPDSYNTLVNQNSFLRQCLSQKYSIPNIGSDGDKK